MCGTHGPTKAYRQTPRSGLGGTFPVGGHAPAVACFPSRGVGGGAGERHWASTNAGAPSDERVGADRAPVRLARAERDYELIRPMALFRSSA